MYVIMVQRFDGQPVVLRDRRGRSRVFDDFDFDRARSYARRAASAAQPGSRLRVVGVEVDLQQAWSDYKHTEVVS